MRARRMLSLGAVASLVAGLAACSSPAPTPAAVPGSSALPADAPVVAFYGDSYTRGTGASAPEKRWSTIVSAERGWYEINRSENGLGFVNRRASMGAGLDDIPALVIADDPDIVFVTMGLNDNFSYDRAADDIRAAIDSDLGRLRDGLPEARIVVVEPFWYTDDRPASVDVIAGGSRTPPSASARTTSMAPVAGSMGTTPTRRQLDGIRRPAPERHRLRRHGDADGCRAPRPRPAAVTTAEPEGGRRRPRDRRQAATAVRARNQTVSSRTARMPASSSSDSRSSKVSRKPSGGGDAGTPMGS